MAESARPTVQTATSGRSRRTSSRPSSSRVQVVRCHPNSVGTDSRMRWSSSLKRPSTLVVPFEGAAIEQPVLACVDKALGRLHDGGRDAAEVAGDLVPGESLSELGDHEEAEGCEVVVGLAPSGDQSASRGAIKPRYVVHGKVPSIFVVGLATATFDGLTFPFNFLPAVRGVAADRDSRTVV